MSLKLFNFSLKYLLFDFFIYLYTYLISIRHTMSQKVRVSGRHCLKMALQPFISENVFLLKWKGDIKKGHKPKFEVTWIISECMSCLVPAEHINDRPHVPGRAGHLCTRYTAVGKTRRYQGDTSYMVYYTNRSWITKGRRHFIRPLVIQGTKYPYVVILDKKWLHGE